MKIKEINERLEKLYKMRGYRIKQIKRMRDNISQLNSKILDIDNSITNLNTIKEMHEINNKVNEK